MTDWHKPTWRDLAGACVMDLGLRVMTPAYREVCREAVISAVVKANTKPRRSISELRTTP